MKKLFLFVTLCIGAYVSQAQSITINNFTGCTIYYKLFGDISTTCGTTYSSGVYSLTAGNSAFYPSPLSIPLLSAAMTPIPVTGYFHEIYIYNSDPNGMPVCPAHTAVNLSNCSPKFATIGILDSNCTDECAAEAKWRLFSGTNNVQVTVD